MKHWRNLALSKRLLTYIIILVIVAISAIGVVSYTISKRALDEKGKTILENGVVMAAAYLDELHEDYERGFYQYDEALESVRLFLTGEKNEAGFRNLETGIDLGEHGYFIIYDLQGNALVHPTLEGQNLWDIVDPNRPDFYIAQMQIDVAVKGGGYLQYAWQFPNESRIGDKITYAQYLPSWQWVVVSTTYEEDFNKDARGIISVIFIAAVLFSAIGIIGASMFVTSITKPMKRILGGMQDAGEGRFKQIEPLKRGDEVGQLVLGFNQMSSAIEKANDHLKRQADRITFLAYNDIISELPNRNRFLDYVNHRIESGIQSGYVLQLDIKDFKIVNSALGSEVGDFILKHVGQSFLAIKDEKSMIARTSGNEFSIWFEDIPQSALIKSINAFKRVLNERLERNQIKQTIDFHYAYAVYPEHGKDFDTLYKHASIAMKYAKENRDLKVYRFEDTMLEVIENDLKMSKLLEYAIYNQEITVAYQNKVSLSSESVVGVEALARWYSSTLGFVSPAVFIPAINRSNLALIFGQYMLEQVFFEYRFIREKFGSTVKVAINISPIFFVEKQFIQIVKHAVEKFSVEPALFVLEITEDIFISDLDNIKETVASLKSMGFSISLDDFGTGYSSLNYLKNIDIDEVKIDKSFIDRITSDDKTVAMLEAIRKITEAYGYEVVAEGVETAEQITILKQVGYDTVQGFYYSKPEPIHYEESFTALEAPLLEED
jgi:diguanylate cyclase (GGDEF)-like protein